MTQHLLLATSNGTGMGHLTRQVAVARAVDVDATIFSLSLGLPLATSLGVRGEYCPSYDMPWIASREWQRYLHDRLIAICEELEVSAVVFDGVAPYPGIAQASAQLPEVAFVWLRRGMWRHGYGAQHLQKGEFFDLVLEPRDLGSAEDSGATSDRMDSRHVGSISILETDPLLTRSEARQSLGLPLDGPVALVTLGSGRLGDVAGPGSIAVETILGQFPGWRVAVTQSPVALNQVPIEHADRMSVIKGTYPLAPYLSAFDMAVSSAGYNAVHELVPAGVPTLFVANSSTRTDDQIARSVGVAAAGLAAATIDTDYDSLGTVIARFRDPDLRNEYAHKAKETLTLMTGARDTASAASEFAGNFTGRKIARPQYGLWRSSKNLVKGALGETGTDAVRRILGREVATRYERSRVVLEAKEAPDTSLPVMSVVGELAADQLPGNGPTEHILPGTSDTYFKARMRIINEYYDIVS